MKFDAASRTFLLLLTGAILLGLGYSFYRPLVLSIDSVYGFLAYKGTHSLQTFNQIDYVNAGNIDQIDHAFVSWWSPGQWLFPAILNRLFGLRLGLASLWVTAACLLSGFTGFYRVFTRFGFSPTVSALSLLLILAGSTMYYSLLLYQGGEILEFGVFPWFLYFLIGLNRLTVLAWLLVFCGLFACFLAKTTLLLYGILAVIAKAVEWMRRPSPRRSLAGAAALLAGPVLCLPVVFFAYLARGPRPALFREFHLDGAAVLVPSSGPLISVLSMQQWIIRLNRVFFTPDQWAARVFPLAIYLIIFSALLFLVFKVSRMDAVSLSYKRFWMVLYLGLSAFFILIYLFQANIDYSSRHFKLLGYLTLPGLLQYAYSRTRPIRSQALVLILLLLAGSDFLYLKQKWTHNRYISINYFYRNLDDLQNMDQLDEPAYRLLLYLDESLPDRPGLPLLFYAEASEDLAIDLSHTCITERTALGNTGKQYRGKGPALVVCISKSTLSKDPGCLKRKFPDYDRFERLSETANYMFYSGKFGDADLARSH
jgi:hypothetical protein